MSITRISKTPNRNLMVDMGRWLTAHLTSFTSNLTGYNFSLFPTYSPIVAIIASSPTRMSRLSYILGLPLSHTQIVTENPLAMKVRGSPYNWLTTPSAILGDFIGRLAMLLPALMVAIKRAINPVETLETIKRFATGRAYLLNCPSLIFESWHSYIIPHIEIEEKYCEIAAKRCCQSVMALGAE